MDKMKTDRCPHCGQRLPLAAWLRDQTRTLWTTAELVARYGGSAEHIGKELKRLGCETQRIRQRLPNGSLSKKRALYCVRPEYFPAFKKATPSQLRSWLARELSAEADLHLVRTAYEVLRREYPNETDAIRRERIASIMTRMRSKSEHAAR